MALAMTLFVSAGCAATAEPHGAVRPSATDLAAGLPMPDLPATAGPELADMSQTTGSPAVPAASGVGPTAEARPIDAPQAQAACSGAVTLEALGDCVQAQMPGTGFGQFGEPGPAIRRAWRGAVRDMLAGRCDARVLPGLLREIYTLTSMVDRDNGAEYCVLSEAPSDNRGGIAAKGWGAFVVSLDPKRRLGIQVPHPVEEVGTLGQGVRMFKETGAWYLLLAGTGRNASGKESDCQAAFDRADVTHNVDHLFQSTVEEAAGLAKQSGVELVHLQLHGMARDTCRGVDVLLSYGVSGLPDGDEILLALQARLEADNPTWVVEVSGYSSACELEGTLNVQGRLLNGVPTDAVCQVAATQATGRFIHIEQKSAARDAERWIEAIRATFPEIVR